MGAGPQTSRGWLDEARDQAQLRLDACGIPTRRDEYWKHTDPSWFQSGRKDGAAPVPVAGEIPDSEFRIAFSDGRLSEAAGKPPNSLRINSLPEAAAISDHWASDLFGKLEARSQLIAPKGFAALNSRSAEKGVVIETEANSRQTLQLHYCAEASDSDAIIHHLVRMAPGSELRLLEFGSAAPQANLVMEVDVMEGASFSHIRLQNSRRGRRSMGPDFARVDGGGTFKQFTLSADHELVRNESVVELCGEGSEAHVSGAVVGGKGSHHDDTVLIVHNAADCRSRQVFKKVLAENSVGVFQGKILVRDGAQKTDGYQISKAMLMGATGQFFAKPELEIYADDVLCSHGSTSGSADADSLFYLRARGIPEPEALNLLALAFLAETLEEIDNENDAEMIRRFMISHLAEHSNAGRN